MCGHYLFIEFIDFLFRLLQLKVFPPRQYTLGETSRHHQIELYDIELEFIVKDSEQNKKK